MQEEEDTQLLIYEGMCSLHIIEFDVKCHFCVGSRRSVHAHEESYVDFALQLLS
jgi:hypothetical protein